MFSCLVGLNTNTGHYYTAVYFTITTLWCNSAADNSKRKKQKTFDFSSLVSALETKKPIKWSKPLSGKYFKLSSAKIFIQSAKG